MTETPINITIYHSPDSDDAFMFYGLVSGAVKYPGFNFDHSLCDIETLNHRTVKGELDVTAVSVHAYAYLKGRYFIMNSGASMGGQDYGPKLVATKNVDIKSRRVIAIPGVLTSAALALRMYLKENNVNAELMNVSFDKVGDVVKEGKADAGVIIHEGQLTHDREGLYNLVDLGKWWWDETGLPLPLGVNVVRKDLGSRSIVACSTVLRQTIQYSLDHRKEALEYALKYGRGISVDEADKFVGMYVNDLTLDLGQAGKRSIELFLQRAKDLQLISPEINAEFVKEEL